MEPPAARLDAPRPRSWSKARRPSWAIAHKPAGATPTERGRINARESMATRGTSRPWASSGAARRTRFQRRGTVRRQGKAAGEEVGDAPAQGRPIVRVNIEGSGEMEQGAVPHLRAGALGAHEAAGEGVLAAAARAGAPDEQGRTLARRGRRDNKQLLF